MGLVESTIMSIIDLVEKVKQDKQKDKLEEEEAKKEDIVKPIVPPKYNSTIEARRKNVKDGPYTVEAIASSLKNDLIPVGYSLEQLRKVGFGADVDEYERRKKERTDTNKKNLINGLEELKKQINKGIVSKDDMSQEDKELFKKYDIFNPVERAKYIKQIDAWIDLAKHEALSDSVLDNMISIMNLKVDDYNDTLKQNIINKQNQQLVDNAILKSDQKILNSVKRAFNNGYYY